MYLLFKTLDFDTVKKIQIDFVFCFMHLKTLKAEM